MPHHGTEANGSRPGARPLARRPRHQDPPKRGLDGLPLAPHLTGGGASDSRQLAAMPDIGPDIAPRAVVTDKECDAEANRQPASGARAGLRPVIPHRPNAKDRPGFFPKALHRARARIGQAIGKPDRFKRAALRREKTAENFAALAPIASNRGHKGSPEAGAATAGRSCVASFAAVAFG